MNQTIGSYCVHDISMPQQMREMPIQSQNRKDLVVLALEHESARTMSSGIAPFRQREVADVVDYARAEKALRETNDKLG